MPPEDETSWVDRVKTAIGLLAGGIAVITWFVGDVPRVGRLSIGAVASAVLILRVTALPFRVLYAAAPLVLLAALAVAPSTRSWLMERTEEPPRGPLLAIEDIRFAFDLGADGDPTTPERLRVDLVLRNRGAEPVIIERLLLGYHQGEFVGGGTHGSLWLGSNALSVSESDSTRTVVIPQSEDEGERFIVPVSAFASWLGASAFDEIIELRPQAEIPPTGLHSLRVTIPLTVALETRRITDQETQTEILDRSQSYSLFQPVPLLEGTPHLLSVTANTTAGACAWRVVEDRQGRITDVDLSLRPRGGTEEGFEVWLDGQALGFKDLCTWAPPPRPTEEVSE